MSVLLNLVDSVAVIKKGSLDYKGSTENIDKDLLIKNMADNNLINRYPRINIKRGELLLQVTELTTHNLLSNITFSLFEGEILGLAGMTGMGKTSVAKAIFGLSDYNSGHVYVSGNQVPKNDPIKSLKHGISYIPEDRDSEGLFHNMSLGHNIASASISQIGSGPAFSDSYIKHLEKKYTDMLAIMTENRARHINNLSGGNKQKALLARWIFKNTKIILLDEPTKGVDFAGKVKIYNILNQLTLEKKGILLISSDLSELIGMCDRILVIRNGKIVYQNKKGHVTEEQIIKISQGL